MLTDRCRLRLLGVHPDLVRVVERARVEIDFIVTEGLRTTQRQRELMAAGATRTLNSRHITGHAVDLAVRVAGEVRWDWPLYHRLGTLMKAAATAESVPIVWGGDWRTFRDGPHFELSRTAYPA
jgi:peptidoglycan L-alanyl-D-glutamate endopeptidase CwlK